MSARDDYPLLESVTLGSGPSPLGDAVANALDEIDRLRALVDDLTYNMPQPTADAPRW